MTADPSVAEHAARLAERADEVALCLDFDGTLSPIVDDRRRPGRCLARWNCSDSWLPGSPPPLSSRAARLPTWQSMLRRLACAT
jgi:hypothetical protein